jgi:hypothetical protein
MVVSKSGTSPRAHPFATSAPSSSRSHDDEPEEKPWLPLAFSLLLLFGSIGLNFYLGWISWGFYLRFRSLAEQVRSLRALA